VRAGGRGRVVRGRPRAGPGRHRGPGVLRPEDAAPGRAGELPQGRPDGLLPAVRRVPASAARALPAAVAHDRGPGGGAVMRALDALGHALAVAGSMTWQITWSLILGFTLSAIVQAVIRRQTITRLLGDDSPRSLAVATGLGAASSSCSYAAVALARALFRRGANFTAAMAFEIASTNLVIELGIILALLLSWQFTLAEFVGGPIMIILMAVAFRLFVRSRLIDAARTQADTGLGGAVAAPPAVDMGLSDAG